jgi:hypothetical protein
MAVVTNLNGLVEGLNTYWVEEHGGAVAQLMAREGSGLTESTVAESREALGAAFPHSTNGAYWIMDPLTGLAELTTVEFGKTLS